MEFLLKKEIGRVKVAFVSLPRPCEVLGLGKKVKPWSPGLCFFLEWQQEDRSASGCCLAAASSLLWPHVIFTLDVVR